MVIAFFAVVRDVEALCLTFLRSPQADGRRDDLCDDPGHHERNHDAKQHGGQLSFEQALSLIHI